MFHRQDLLKGFYNNLSETDKARILVNKNVVDIEMSDSLVRVHCDDGTIEEGDMVIGADGVHSSTRQLMRELALKATPPGATAAVNDEKPWLATYRVLYGSVPKRPDWVAGDDYESHGDHVCIQFFVGRERAWFFVYSELPEPTKERAYYSQQDADGYAETYGELHVTEKLKFRDVYAGKYASGLTNLEEGVMKHWSWRRIVLAGDAVHKVTPNIGWGFNSSVHDLVVLVNRLRALLQEKGSDPIATEALESVFAGYQAERFKHMSHTTAISGKVTRLSTWKSRYRWIIERYIFPIINADHLLVTYAIGTQIMTVPQLDWLDEKYSPSGRVPWEHATADEQKGIAKKRGPTLGWRLVAAAMPSIIALL